MSSRIYSITDDFGNGYEPVKLAKESNGVITNKILLSIDVDVENNILTVTFDQNLTPGEINDLDNVIANHIPSDSDPVEQRDDLDNDLLKLLGERMKVAENIGLIKKEKGITILQTNRWEEIIEKASSLGALQGLSEKFMVRYLNAVHQESIDHQNEVMNNDEMVLKD